MLLALVGGASASGGGGGMPRDEAYRIVQELAGRAWEEGIPLRDLLAVDERTQGLDLDSIFDYDHYVRYSGEIIGRLDRALVRMDDIT